MSSIQNKVDISQIGYNIDLSGTDHTVVGNMIVQSQHATTGALYGASATFRTRKVGTNIFITYRMN